jgi:ADP-heptose:LPS heptosyltransferase
MEYGGRDAAGIDFLAALMSKASVVVAPSTGPLHVAVAVGTPVVTFYPPVRVMSALRWGPYLNDEEHSSVLVPDVYCGQAFKCRGSLCHYYPCMRSLTVEGALDQVRKQVALRRRKET